MSGAIDEPVHGVDLTGLKNLSGLVNQRLAKGSRRKRTLLPAAHFLARVTPLHCCNPR